MELLVAILVWLGCFEANGTYTASEMEMYIASNHAAVQASSATLLCRLWCGMHAEASSQPLRLSPMSTDLGHGVIIHGLSDA